MMTLDIAGPWILLSVVLLATLGFVVLGVRRQSQLRARAETAEAALRHADAQLAALVDRFPLPVFIIDREARLQAASDSLLAMLSVDRPSVVGRPLAGLMTPKAAEPFLAKLLPEVLAQRPVSDHPAAFVAGDGSVVETRLSATPRTGDTGEVSAVVGGLVDVTRHLQAEEVLLQSRKGEAIGQLTDGIAHDFNNLLAVILGSLELIAKAVPSDPRVDRLIENAIASVTRGAALTQRMLAFTRTQPPELQAVSIPDVLAGLMDLLRRSIGPMVCIQTRLPPDLPAALVDPRQLELAIVNLAVNAQKAMPTGGEIMIAASHRTSDGQTGDLKAGSYVVLALSDTGVGMDAATLARASVPAFSLRAATPGTGIGLQMVHALAAQSGGQVQIRSKRGFGTLIELWLPAAGSTPAAAVAVAPQMNQAAGLTTEALSVLVVDDDALVLMGTVAMLEDLGHKVYEAASGKEALAIVEAGTPLDLMVTDQAMPEMTGLQLAEAVTGLRPDLPIILSTGYADLPAGTGRGLRRLIKPFGRSALSEAIDAALAKTS